MRWKPWGGVLVAVTAALLAWGAGPARALEARALVDRDTLTMEDVLALTVVVSDGDGAVDTSPIRDFAVADRGRSSSVQIVNMSMTREVRYRFALTPRRQGTLTVPALTVGEGRDAAVTDPISVRVLPRRSGPATVGDVAVEAEVSDPTPYLGQEIIYTFRLLAATQIADARYQAPGFEGFTATPLEDQRRYTTVRNGRQLSVTELSYLLVPLREGELVIEPARLSCQVPGAGAVQRRDPFGMLGDPFFRRGAMREKSLACAPLTVTAQALPPVPTGEPFSGLVGRLRLNAAVSPAQVRAGESATLTLVLEGEGNVGEAAAPELGLPAGFKVYPDDPEPELTRDSRGSRGSVRFRFALVPAAAGTFSLGPFRLLTFDPDAGVYRPLQAGPLALTVTPGAPPPAAPAGAAAGDDLEFQPRRRVEKTGHDILALHTGLDAIRPRSTLGAGLVAAALAVPLLVYLGVWGATARRGRRPTAGEAMRARARDELAAADRAGEPAEVLAALRRALVAAVGAALGRRAESFTADEVRRGLGAAGVAPERAAAVAELLGRLDAARYGRGADDPALRRDVAAAVTALARGGRS